MRISHFALVEIRQQIDPIDLFPRRQRDIGRSGSGWQDIERADHKITDLAAFKTCRPLDDERSTNTTFARIRFPAEKRRVTATCKSSPVVVGKNHKGVLLDSGALD